MEASRSRVGIAERDDIFWFRCIFRASRKRPLRAGCDHHAALLRENGRCANGAIEALSQSGSHSESLTSEIAFR